MANIREEILNAASITRASITELSSETTSQIRQNVRSKFGDEKPAKSENYFAVNDVQAWAWVGDFVENSKVIMFFLESDEQTMFEFKDGSQVVPVLSESYGFEFYLTNPNLDYLLFFNHHDYLIALGKAANWLKTRAKVTSA